MLFRLLEAAAAAFGAAVVVAIAYAIVDLYMTGHGYASHTGGRDPWYSYVFTVALFLVPLLVAIHVWRRR